MALGAVFIERHITLDRAMWGSDQAASVEPQGLHRLVRDIRVISEALGDGVKQVYDGERAAMKKLRRVPGVLADEAELVAGVMTSGRRCALVESPAQLLNVLELDRAEPAADSRRNAARADQDRGAGSTSASRPGPSCAR